MQSVEPPAESELFDEYIEPVDGDWDRDYWVQHCVQFLGLDENVASERSTEWLVGWVKEKNDRIK